MVPKCVHIMFVFIIFSVLVNFVVGQYECQDLLDLPIMNVTLNSTDEVIIDSLEINDIEDAFVDDSYYVDTSISGNILIVKTTKALATTGGKEPIFATIIVECDGEEYVLVYDIKVEESNCEELRFEDTFYSYIFYDMLFSADRFDMDLKAITVQCVDGTINFIIEENDYFAIEDKEMEVISSGTYNIGLRVLQDIYAPFDKTFTLTALDDANRTATTAFRVEVIESTYSYLKFTESLYFGYIDTDLNIVIDNGPIAFEDDVDLEDVDIQISPEFKIFFEINYYPEISLSLGTERSITELIQNSDVLDINLTAYNLENNISVETIVRLDLALLREGISSTKTLASTTATSSEDQEKDSDVTITTTTEASYKDDEENSKVTVPSTTEVVYDDEEGDYVDTEFADGREANNLNVFNFWVSRSRSMIVITVVFTMTFVISAIFYLKLRLASRRAEF